MFNKFYYNNNELQTNTNTNTNIVNRALRRVRSGGSVAPPKKAHNTHNAYTPTPKSIPFNQPQKIVNKTITITPNYNPYLKPQVPQEEKQIQIKVKMPVKQNFGF